MDISALNAVYLRNLPPTPANHAQRAGRAGRSGQAALIVTYCAAQSPHDQYFPHDRNATVSGTVRAPALDLLNEQLLTSHLQAVWLAASGVALAAEIPQILDLSKPDAPLREEIAAAIQAQGLPQRARRDAKPAFPDHRQSGHRRSGLDDRHRRLCGQSRFGSASQVRRGVRLTRFAIQSRSAKRKGH